MSQRPTEPSNAADDGQAQPQIRWVAFDAVGTLFFADPSVPLVYHRVACKQGSRLSAGQISQRWDRVVDEGLSAGARTASLSTSEQQERDFWRNVVARVIDDVTDPDRCFEELYQHFGRPEAWRCYAGVERVLRWLQSAGLRLAVASNFDERLHTVCDGLIELRAIELRLVSSEIGFRKPSPKFYHALVDAAGCRADQILMVGDHEINDVAGACAAGLHALRASPAEFRAGREFDELFAWLGL